MPILLERRDVLSHLIDSKPVESTPGKRLFEERGGILLPGSHIEITADGHADLVKTFGADREIDRIPLGERHVLASKWSLRIHGVPSLREVFTEERLVYSKGQS